MISSASLRSSDVLRRDNDHDPGAGGGTGKAIPLVGSGRILQTPAERRCGPPQGGAAAFCAQEPARENRYKDQRNSQQKSSHPG
jgi:hypothetical protein